MKTKNNKKQANRSKDYSITFRTTKEFAEQLKRMSDACKLKQSEFIRKSCLAQKVRALPPDIFYELKDFMEEALEQKEKNGGLFESFDTKRLAKAVEQFTSAVQDFYLREDGQSDGDN